MSKKVKSPLIRIKQLNKAIYMIFFFFGITIATSMKIIRTLKNNFVFVIIIIFVHKNLSALNTSIHVPGW